MYNIKQKGNGSDGWDTNLYMGKDWEISQAKKKKNLKWNFYIQVLFITYIFIELLASDPNNSFTDGFLPKFLMLWACAMSKPRG